MSFQVDHNALFQFAADCINYSNRSVFLTGKAGTGKTTFLKYIKEHIQKQTVVLAPTGVAAINAGGVTIHSFFQLPLGPFVPGSVNGFTNNSSEITDKHHLLGRLRYDKEKIQLLQNLELLIIDEISMVRCDVLDAIDIILKHFRYRHHEPFGGVQMLLIGDMYQLPPVAVQEELKILSAFYNSPYFFDSLVMQQYPPLHIELEKIYRQSDPQFISVLNKIRNNKMDHEAMQLLHTHYNRGFQPQKEQGYITLATHNYLADNINAKELQTLPGDLFSFKATIEGEFSEKSYPAEELLQLKHGAQVMFLKNDMEKVRRYFNGKIGIVEKIEDEKIFVRCANEKPIEVKKYKWENIRYSLNKTTWQLEEKVIGSFEQYPLRLAWAITIHKSQGLTFEKAVIDAGAAFACGQVYVALSRCTSLQGMILRSPITHNALFTDERINRFAKNKNNTDQLPNELKEAKHRYQQTLLVNLFDFSRIVKMCEQFLTHTEEHKSSFNPETIPWVQNIFCKTEALQTVAQKFQPQLEQLSQQQLPEENALLQQRVNAAAQYFSKEMQQLLQLLSQSPAVTDSRQYATNYNEELKNVYVAVANRLHIINGCINGFNVANYHIQKKNFTVPSFNINAYAKASSYTYKENPHPELLKQLRKLRDVICDKNGWPIYIVAGTNTLEEMARYLPQTLEELWQISGFGKAKIEKFGQQFLDTILKYSAQHNLTSLIKEKIPKRIRKEEKEKSNKSDTKFETYQLYKAGKTVAEIAAIRNLTPQTIEGHLAHYVKTGDIEIEKLVSADKLMMIRPLLEDFNNISLIKEKLGDAVSYGEIRLALAWKETESRMKK
ncbi:MAG TPA: helix-turn-helix domain-containing protein [Chitinophagaceae bacterium]|jgi:hypothetical protein